MHGYFLSLRLYDAARAIANPFLYEEHRAKRVQEKLDKLAESRIRSRKDAQAPKVNKSLAKRLQKEEERFARHEEKRERRKKEIKGHEEEQGDAEVDGKPTKASLLNDPRFSALFEDPEFEVDEGSREFSLLNPSVASQGKKAKTPVEEEEEDTGDRSSDSLGESSTGSDEEDGSTEDSSDAGDLDRHSRRAQSTDVIVHTSSRRYSKQPRMVAAAPQVQSRTGQARSVVADKNASFGQRRRATSSGTKSKQARSSDADPNGEMEISWVPQETSGVQDPDDMLIPGGRGKPRKDKSKQRVETFGFGMERGRNDENGSDRKREVSEHERHGRTRRRSNVRSGSKNAFRGL